MKILTPAEVKKLASKKPGFVTDAFNKLLVRNHNPNGNTRISIHEAIEEMRKLKPELTRGEIFKFNYLDVEDTYREKGWSVSFHKIPQYPDSSYYIFSPKK